MLNVKCVAKCKAKYLENIQITNETTPASNNAAKIERQSQRQRQSLAGMAGRSLGVLDIERVVIAAVRAALQGVAPPVHHPTSATLSCFNLIINYLCRRGG